MIEERFHYEVSGLTLRAFAFNDQWGRRLLEALSLKLNKPLHALRDLLVDLRLIIEDDSSNLFEYLEALHKVVEVVKRRGEVVYGCAHGCGRTFTVTLALLGVLRSGRIDQVLKDYERLLGIVGEVCPENYHQMLFASTALLASQELSMDLNNFDVVELGKKMVEIYMKNIDRVREVMDQLMEVQNRVLELDT